MILNVHALHHICIIILFHAFKCVFTLLQWLYAGRFRLGWAHDVFKFACHMFIHFSCIRTFKFLYSYILPCWWFSNCLSLSLSLFLALVCFMGPKRKSTPSQNPLHFGASTFSYNPTPSHVRFHDDKARKDFLENFYRQGIHLECQVILSDFSDTDLPTIIYS